MKVLIACEESQEVCKAFRKMGHEAYSCDIQEPSGGHPEWHIFGDALLALRGGADRNDGRRNARRRKLGSAYCASALHLFEQRRSEAPLEEPPAPRGSRHKRHSRQGFIYAVLVGGHSENLRRKPDSEQGFCPSEIYTKHPAVPVWAPLHEEDLPLAKRAVPAGTNGRCGTNGDVVPFRILQPQARGTT